MIVINIDNGEWYDSYESWPVVVCVDWGQARAAEKEFNAWHQRLRAFFKEATPERNIPMAARIARHDRRRAWLKENPPPFWAPSHDPSYSDDSVCDYSIDLVEVPIYQPKDPA